MALGCVFVCVHLSLRASVCVIVLVCVGHLEDLYVPIEVGVKEEAAESTCLPPQHTHTLILCPNPHITPHLVMKTSSIIPLDRPQGPKADSSLWGLLFVD